jgi:alkyldihydroxyacetonephosphate synthase
VSLTSPVPNETHAAGTHAAGQVGQAGQDGKASHQVDCAAPGPEAGDGFGPETGEGYGPEGGDGFGPETGEGYGPEGGDGFGSEAGDADGRGVWWGWGEAAAHSPLPAGVRGLLETLLGVTARERPPVALADVSIPPAALPPAARAAIARVVGADHVRADQQTRVRHCRGRSTADLLRLRAGDGGDAPDAVVYPAGHDEVLAVLRICAEHRVAVVPFGGGTSVVGGLAPQRSVFAGAVALDMGRMARLVAVDTTSQVAVLEPGLRGPEAEELLAAHGLTLGHVPQSFEYATVGGFAATRSAGQASAGHGRFDDLVVGLRLATPVGTWDLGRAPASAAGPDLRQVVLGSEGAFGVITSMRLRVRPLPEARRFEGWQVGDFASGLHLVRSLAQAGVLPSVVRLSDEMETAAGLANARQVGTPTVGSASLGPAPVDGSAAGGSAVGGGSAPLGGSAPVGGSASLGGSAPVGGLAPLGDSVSVGSASDDGSAAGDSGVLPPPGGCYLVAGYEGASEWVDDRRTVVGEHLRAGGATPLGEGVGREWLRGRFHAPYLRDALLDVGMFAETLETAGFWSDIPGLYAAVRDAVTGSLAASGSPPLVMCHVSHAYPTGASLYFTVVCGQGEDPIGQWRKAKAAASAAITAVGGTITHHHAVGTDHQPWLAAEVGEIGIAVLRAVKDTLDPTGIMNPGILVPPDVPQAPG